MSLSHDVKTKRGVFVTAPSENYLCIYQSKCPKHAKMVVGPARPWDLSTVPSKYKKVPGFNRDTWCARCPAKGTISVRDNDGKGICY